MNDIMARGNLSIMFNLGLFVTLCHAFSWVNSDSYLARIIQNQNFLLLT